MLKNWPCGFSRRSKNAVSLACLLAIIGASAFAVAGNTTWGKLIPPQAKFRGDSYGEYAADWWQWVLAIPFDENPLFDETGENAANGQNANVFYLTGVVGGGPVERSITIEPGTPLFFPILNTLWVSTEPEDPQTAEEILELLGALQAEDLFLEIDGTEYENLEVLYTESPLFSTTLELLGFPEGEAFGPAFTYGYWAMLAPLSVGEHTLRFGGKASNNFGTNELEVIYHITVQPKE